MYKNATTTKRVLIDRRSGYGSRHKFISDSDHLDHAYKSAKYFLVPRYLTINELNCAPKVQFHLLFSSGANFLFSKGFPRALISTLPDWFVCFVGVEKIFNFLRLRINKDLQAHPSLTYLKMSAQELKLIAQNLKSKQLSHDTLNAEQKVVITNDEKARLRKIKASQHYKT